jgi:F-box interacting protein
LNLGIGCAIPSGTYKVVNFSKYDPCKVLTLEDDAKWRQMDSPATPSLVPKGYNLGSPVTVNGVMHFLYRSLTPLVQDDHMLHFDLESEEWKAFIKGPMTSRDDLRDDNYMVKLNNALCIVQRSSTNARLIWVLTDSAKGTWVKLYTIPMVASIHSLRPLTVRLDGRKLLLYTCDWLTATPGLQVYDPLTKTCTHLTQFARNLFRNSSLCVLHLEYFVSPKILPTPSVFSQLIPCQWLHRLNPLSLLYK